MKWQLVLQEMISTRRPYADTRTLFSLPCTFLKEFDINPDE
jgi:hypothetical protein